MKGTIALDIDGTLTDSHDHIHQDVIDYLIDLHNNGWDIAFITGRPFSWGHLPLKPIPFEYTFSIQNGAITLAMPSKKILRKKCLETTILPLLTEVCKEEPTDVVIFSGFENNDFCYFRPDYFEPSLLRYILERKDFLDEKWIPLQDFSELPFKSFPSAKCFGSKESLKRISSQLNIAPLNLESPLNTDPFKKGEYVLQITQKNINKGQALLDCLKAKGSQAKPVIAVGDDHNDLSMFKAATLKVVMETAPDEVLQQADIIAPPASKLGVIKGLTEALKMVEGR